MYIRKVDKSELWVIRGLRIEYGRLDLSRERPKRIWLKEKLNLKFQLWTAKGITRKWTLSLKELNDLHMKEYMNARTPFQCISTLKIRLKKNKD